MVVMLIPIVWMVFGIPGYTKIDAIEIYLGFKNGGLFGVSIREIPGVSKFFFHRHLRSKMH